MSGISSDFSCAVSYYIQSPFGRYYMFWQVAFIIMHHEQDSSMAIISSSESEGDKEGTDELQPSVHKVHSVDNNER